MMDMVHYLFETDTLGEEETQKAKLKMRRTLYKVLYLRDYKWMENQGDNEYREFGTQEAGGVGAEATEFTHKPYIPPTPVNADSPLPFGNALMPPMG